MQDKGQEHVVAADRNLAGNEQRRGNARPPAPGAPHDFAAGTHLVTLRRGYAHHGIYVGNGRVVHYSGLSRSLRRGPVEEVSLEHFAAGRTVLIKPTANARFDGTEVVARARSRLGEDRYRIASNNCEHFCAWCVYGEPRSEQVERLVSTRLLSFLRRFRPFSRPSHALAERPAESCAA
jgi:hypothetical protein